ncbi:hypothetical protein HS99_0004675 [Kitasatospora aureofaciens]|uniref:Uncharacterized protein n=1 Tax=Kitasatospora aureofaciens TaxID=1894 RepID=A0A1E7N8U5_KITAU|nr:hypothetical protein HS99_0004675 [Kitasatospora aureofaciens]
MTPVTGITRAKPATPATGTSCVSICSVPYALELMQSGASTPNATGFDSFSARSCAVTSGGPSSNLFTR